MKKFISLKNPFPMDLSAVVAAEIRNTLRILDDCYGSDRTDSQLGGYVLIVENEDDLNDLTSIFNEPIKCVIPEFTDKICDNYLKSLYILNPDFSVTILFPIELSPDIIKKYITS
ncbi:MAG: hypothetical protein J1G06_02850 [Oscillospiraceae bacterium]|nr:hypothetical protein [Oscillospiraceae bacterium]